MIRYVSLKYLRLLYAVALLFVCRTSLANDSIPVVEIKSFVRYDGILGKEVDETDLVRKERNFVLDYHDRYFTCVLSGVPAGQKPLYRIEGFDATWYPLDGSPVRTGVLPEGKYRFVVAVISPAGEWQTLFVSGIQVRAPFFQGFRGFLATIITVLVLIFLIYRGRIWYLSLDRNRTVKMLENTVQRRTGQLQQSVKERELLLKEIHHRVKNNLQVISALLEMQASRTDDDNVRAAIREGQNRVLSIAFIHQNLYQHDDLKGVEIGSFLKELISHVRQVFERDECPITIENLVPDFFIDIESATPLGLIINELLTNSYKYAFPGRKEGNIRIEMKELGGGKFYFSYCDDGCGLPPNFDFGRSNSLGLKLIRQLSRQLAGNITYKYSGGSVFEFTFSNLEARSKMI